jgi:hypothetical protein
VRILAPLAMSLLLVPLLAGCSGGDDGGQVPLPAEWLGHDLRKGTWVNETLQPYQTVAYQYDLSGGKHVAWEYVAVAPQPAPYLHFQLVRMDGDDPRTARPLVAEDRREGGGERTIVQSGTHQLDWMNEWDQELTVAVNVPAGGKRIVYEDGEGPGCLFASAVQSSGTACLRDPLPVLPPPPSTLV